MKATELNATVPYATDDELYFLKHMKVNSVVMLGAGPGVMALAVFEGNPNCHITIVDNVNIDYAMAHCEAAGYRPSGLLLDSKEAAEAFLDNSIDLLIVDADHSYEGVRDDILAWKNKIKLYGYIFFHDYDATGTRFEAQEQYSGVKQAIDDHLPDNFIRSRRIGTAVVFYREH